jgi:hypothetical protein
VTRRNDNIERRPHADALEQRLCHPLGNTVTSSFLQWRPLLLATPLLAFCLLLAKPHHAPAGGVPGAPPTADARVELVASTPPHIYRGRAPMLIRVVNLGRTPLAGATEAEYAQNRPAIYAGAWFSTHRPDSLAAFTVAVRLESPLPPGGVTELTLFVAPTNIGTQYLSFGLYQASLKADKNGPVGVITSVPVEVIALNWLDEHRGVFLQGLIGAHSLAFLIGLALLLRRATLR